jgi:hypothetical protein
VLPYRIKASPKMLVVLQKAWAGVVDAGLAGLMLHSVINEESARQKFGRPSCVPPQNKAAFCPCRAAFFRARGDLATNPLVPTWQLRQRATMLERTVIVRAVRSLASQMISRAPKGRSRVTNGRQLFIDGDARLKVSWGASRLAETSGCGN